MAHAPYLRHKKHPYTIFPYSTVLAQRPDMVEWWDAPKLEEINARTETPVPEFAERPDSMTEEAFQRQVAEEKRVAALRGEDDPKLFSKNREFVQFDPNDVVNPDGEIAPRPKNAMSEDDFMLVAEPEEDNSPQPAKSPEPLSTPVENTDDGIAAKRSGKKTRPERAVDTFHLPTSASIPRGPRRVFSGHSQE